MTGNELYEYGRTSAPAMAVIPQELVQTLPRLERMEGRVVLQYWYYFHRASCPVICDTPLYYASFDPHRNCVVEMKAYCDDGSFMQSWLDLVSSHPQMREIRYLEYCARLLQQGDITEEEITQSQAMWLDAQAGDIFPWLYFRSGIRPGAVQRLLSPQMAEKGRFTGKLWIYECMKYIQWKEQGYHTLHSLLTQNVPARDVYYELLDRGPMIGMRMESEY